MYLEVGGDGASADVDELRHVVVGVEGPDAVLQVEVFVQLDALGLAHLGVELVGPVEPGAQRDAVVRHVVQEARVCGEKRKEEKVEAPSRGHSALSYST